MSRELNLQPEEAVCFVVLLGFIKVFLVNTYRFVSVRR